MNDVKHFYIPTIQFEKHIDLSADIDLAKTHTGTLCPVTKCPRVRPMSADFFMGASPHWESPRTLCPCGKKCPVLLAQGHVCLRRGKIIISLWRYAAEECLYGLIVCRLQVRGQVCFPPYTHNQCCWMCDQKQYNME